VSLDFLEILGRRKKIKYHKVGSGQIWPPHLWQLATRNRGDRHAVIGEVRRGSPSQTGRRAPLCCVVYESFSVTEWNDLQTGGRSRSRSLKMAPFDRSYTTLYWSAIVSIAVGPYVVTFSSYLTLNNRDLEKVTEGHLNCYHSKDWVRFPIRLP